MLLEYLMFISQGILQNYFNYRLVKETRHYTHIVMEREYRHIISNYPLYGTIIVAIILLFIFRKKITAVANSFLEIASFIFLSIFVAPPLSWLCIVLILNIFSVDKKVQYLAEAIGWFQVFQVLILIQFYLYFLLIYIFGRVFEKVRSGTKTK